MLQPYGGKAELLLAIPEYKVPLPGASRGDSQNDVLARARTGVRTFAITVEGKERRACALDWMGVWDSKVLRA